MAHELPKNGPYTTGQLAKLFSVAPRTVTAWCTAGTLKCSRLPNRGKFVEGKGDRRVTHVAVMEMLTMNPTMYRPDHFTVEIS